MKVRDIMTTDVKTCGADTRLSAAAAIMWASDCGAVPVVDAAQKVLSVITDRDICIATATRDRLASEIRVDEIKSGPVFTCGPDDDMAIALQTMADKKIRRLPVVNAEGRLVGIFSLNDVILQAEQERGKVSYVDTIRTLKAICGHRALSQVAASQ